MTVKAGDVLYAYVYLDASSTPTEIMLQWNNGNWNHRAYWGANTILYGTTNTAERRYMGPLPAKGQWVRLEVPASAVALEGSTVSGMAFSQVGGRATWDNTGSYSVIPTITVAATDASATIGSTTDTATFTFTRTGGTTNALTVNFTLGGTAIKWNDYRRPEGDMPSSITIPAGASSVVLTINAIANCTSASPETVLLTLVSDASYLVGTSSASTVTILPAPVTSTGTTTPPTDTTTTPPVTTTPPDTTTTGTSTTTTVAGTEMDYTGLIMPKLCDHTLYVITPNLIEVKRINTKPSITSPVDSWNFVDANNTLTLPAISEFAVTVNGVPVTVTAVGFRRRALSAPLDVRDLRLDNSLYLQLSTSIAEGQVVEVKNPSGCLWASSEVYKTAANPLRWNPAIHVNEEGYVPAFSKKAKVGYYLGSLGELNVSSTLGFKLVKANTTTVVYQGTLTARPDVGWVYTPTPYQKVLEADFTSFTTPGQYQILIPGMGASLPFLIDDGIAMGFLRTYALGIYHQRCGTTNAIPYTRFTKDACHIAPAEVPSPQANYAFTWTTIAGKNADYASNPRHTAPQLKDEASQLYPFVNKGTIDVSGGHHDAGDYSKYTINVAHLTHLLMFTADSIPGAAALDNLGLPESGDGISDIMQEAKREADYLAKLQDADGGFYFLVYPKTREYESNVQPDHGDSQVVWPKNTSVTAAGVAALAQCASSPRFKAAFPAEAALYLQKAKLGWQFLMNAIAKYGKDGAYQKVTFYSDNWMHDDELAWAAAEMYVATGDTQYQSKLFEFFPDPNDANTYRWGWWRMSESWGNAIRAYAFAVRDGRLNASQLNATYLAKCEAEVVAAGDAAQKWSNQSAYGTSFPEDTKHFLAAGWYFSLDQASDMAAAYQVSPKQSYIDALVANMDYEAGSNPVNVTYLTGIGLKRQRETVNQYARTDRRVLPPTGIPQGNIQCRFDPLDNYGSDLTTTVYPLDSATTSPYPFYDRWTDTWNVTTEFITVNQARSLLAMSAIATLTPAKSTAWTTATPVIAVPTTVVQVASPTTLSVTVPGMNLSNARIVWEARDQEPSFGATYTISPKNNGAQWVEVEIQWPDGRRVSAASTFMANSPIVNWVNGSIPSCGEAGSDGGDGWNWVTSNPTPTSAPAVHQSNIGTGLHEHWFDNTSSPLVVSVGDKMFAWVYLDPVNTPTEIMLMWNDGNWEHRAYWGDNSITYGQSGTVSRTYVGALPAAGQWVKLEVPASAVALEGSIVKGMGFSLYGGRASWDVAGKSSN